jgi:hypothetical protein
MTHMPGFLRMSAGRTQQMLLSLIPATALLLIGACGSQLVSVENGLLFSTLFFSGALLTFFGEETVSSYMQQVREKRYEALTTACRQFLAGNWGTKVAVEGQGELATLAKTINLLLDQQRQLLQQLQTTPPPTPANPPSFVSTQASMPGTSSTEPLSAQSNAEAKLLKEQLLRIISALAPITQGDLRVQVPRSDNLVGAIADTCNSFIEELSRFVKWTRYASQVVTTASRSILDRSLEMARNTENQMNLLSTTTTNIEGVASFIQHLSSNLYLHLSSSKDVQRDILERVLPIELTSETPAGQLLRELQRQTEAFESILYTAEQTSTQAEALIGDLYTVAQQIYQSSVSSLTTVKRLSELSTLAERWYTIASSFTVFEEEGAGARSSQWLL